MANKMRDNNLVTVILRDDTVTILEALELRLKVSVDELIAYEEFMKKTMEVNE